MTEDGKPLEALLEDAARARRLAIVLDGDPAALKQTDHSAPPGVGFRHLIVVSSPVSSMFPSWDRLRWAVAEFSLRRRSAKNHVVKLRDSDHS